MVSEVDLVVGSLTKMLEDRNLLDDTLIIFTSDNGGLKGTTSAPYGHLPNGLLRGSKVQIWEGGHRVPLIMRHGSGGSTKLYPAGGEKRHNLVGLNDLYATLCDIAGVPVPKKQAKDSISFADHIASSDAPPCRQYLGTWTMGKRCKRERGKSIRKGKYKLVYVLDKDCNVKRLLFDLDEDLYETNDLSSDPKHERMIQQMEQKLTKMWPELDLKYYDNRTGALVAFPRRRYRTPTSSATQIKRSFRLLVSTRRVSSRYTVSNHPEPTGGSRNSHPSFFRRSVASANSKLVRRGFSSSIRKVPPTPKLPLSSLNSIKFFNDSRPPSSSDIVCLTTSEIPQSRKKLISFSVVYRLRKISA